MENYLAIKINDALICTTVWVNLENVMLSERNQAHRATYYMILLMSNVHSRQI
jgi:hypothetical protein